MIRIRTCFTLFLGAFGAYACLAPHYGIDARLDEDEPPAAGTGAAPTAGSAPDAGGTEMGSGATSSTGGAGGAPPDDGPPVIVEGNGCETADAYACKAAAQPGRLLCQDGVWTSTDDCEADHNCEQISGDCLLIVEACSGAAGGKRFCSEGHEVSECGADLVTTTVIEPCAEVCVETGSTAECVPESCGDNLEQAPEECDDGDEDDTDDCTAACKDARCGDTVIWDGHETCDDGNQVKETCEYGASSCTVCDAYCNEVPGTISYCGDGKHQMAAEQCDQSAAGMEHGCNPACEDTNWALWQLPPVSNTNYSYGTEFVRDITTGLEWERVASTTTRNWEDAKQYCEDLEIANETDWRLPTRMELMSILDYGKATIPMIHSAFSDQQTGTFWTSYGEAEGYAWYVNFSTGSIGVFLPTVSTRVRCVR